MARALNATPDTLSQHLSRWGKALAGREKRTREMWIDRLVLANKSWSPDELSTLWGQNREPSNYPIIHPVHESVCGMEASTRRDTSILARVGAHRDTAEALTHLLKYVDQQNRAPMLRSKAFRAASGSDGVGWTETCWSDDPRAESIAKRHVDAMHMWEDPAGREDDLSDYQDLFRARWLPPAWIEMRWDLSQLRGIGTSANPAIYYDPSSGREKYETLHGDERPVALMEGGWGGDPNFGPGHGFQAPLGGIGWATQDSDNWWRVNRYEGLSLVVERWYRADEWAQFCVLKDGRVIEITPDKAPRCAELILSGAGRLVRGVSRRIRSACFIADGSIGGGLLHDVPSPYPHGEFPFTPTWGYRDDEGQPYGIVRLLRDASREYNMRRTSLTKRSLMRQVHYESDAFENEAEALVEIAKYNGAVRYRDGALMAGKAKVVDNGGATPGMAAMEEHLLTTAFEMVQNHGPVARESLGQQTNAVSGAAIEQRQEQTTVGLYHLLDNRNWAQQREQEQTLALIQESYTEEKEIRITGSKKGLDWLHINKKDPQTGVVLTDISQGRYDVIVDDQPEAPTVRAAKIQAIAPLLQSPDLPPAIKLKITAAMAEAQDLPTDVLQVLDEAVQMMAQMAQQQGPPPSSPKNVTEKVSMTLDQLTPGERAQVLTAFGVQPDPQGPPPPAEGQPAGPTGPDPAMAAQVDLAKQQAQHAHEAEQNQLQREHELVRTQMQHHHGLESAQHQADITPPPPSAGADL